MKLPLLWRMVAPTLAVSVVLMLVGFGAALYMYLWNVRVAADLDRRVNEVLAAGELVFAIRDVRVELTGYLDTESPAFLSKAKLAAGNAALQMQNVRERSFAGAAERVSRVERGVTEMAEGVKNLSHGQWAEAEEVRVSINDRLLPDADGLLEHSQRAVTSQSLQNQRVAGMVGASLAVLGLCGAAAGLLAGYGVARSIARSIEQLGGSVQTIAETLADEPSQPPPPIDELRELIVAMSDISEKTAGVVSELEQSRETAVRTDQMAAVGQLAAGIAHEVRNPLTAVKLLVDTAVEQNRSLPDVDLTVVQEEVRRMDEMLRSLLDFARPPSVFRRPIDLADVVTQGIELVRPRASALGVAIECRAGAPIIASADAQQVRQVVVNLLMNAIDAQPDGGRVRVDVAYGELDGGPSGLVRVADAGPGVVGDVADRLFEPFVSTKETGVGLGLAICRRIVQSHGGQIEAGCAPEGGALFSVAIPLEPAAATAVSYNFNVDNSGN